MIDIVTLSYQLTMSRNRNTHTCARARESLSRPRTFARAVTLYSNTRRGFRSDELVTIEDGRRIRALSLRFLNRARIALSLPSRPPPIARDRIADGSRNGALRIFRAVNFIDADKPNDAPPCTGMKRFRITRGYTPRRNRAVTVAAN